jgi:ATP-dependent Clp protease ATP-binding subunit ClpA
MRRLGDSYLGTEHVLLGLVRNEGGTAVRMLDRLGVSPETLEDRLYQLRRQAAG